MPLGRKRAKAAGEEARKLLTEGDSKMESQFERWADQEDLLETPKGANLAWVSYWIEGTGKPGEPKTKASNGSPTGSIGESLIVECTPLCWLKVYN